MEADCFSPEGRATTLSRDGIFAEIQGQNERWSSEPRERPFCDLGACRYQKKRCREAFVSVCCPFIQLSPFVSTASG